MEVLLRSINFRRWRGCVAVLIVHFCLFPGIARGEIQFDFFPGFRNCLVQNRVCPLTFEIFDESQAIRGVIRVSYGSQGSSGTVTEFPVEVAAGTRKRIQVPFMAQGVMSRNLLARLVDQSGKVIAEDEKVNISVLSWPSQAYLSLTQGGLRKFTVPSSLFTDNMQFALESSAQANFGGFFNLRSFEFPDRSLLLGGVGGIFLESAALADLSAQQIRSIMRYVETGGTVILSVGQPAEVMTSTEFRDWLGMREVSAASPASIEAVKSFVDTEIMEKLVPFISGDEGRSMANRGDGELIFEIDDGGDPGLDAFNLSTAPLESRPAAVHHLQFSAPFTVLASVGDNLPVLQKLHRGQGTVLVVPFSIQRSPLNDWKSQAWFWTAGFEAWMPSSLQSLSNSLDRQVISSSFSMGSVITWFGSAFSNIVRTAQIKKIPVVLIMCILAVYLIIIGPADWFVLKKINKQMWTWVTFPAAVIIFSGIIYLVGYSIRAGRTEWRAVHVADLGGLNSDGPVIGTTFAGIYSPANRRYGLDTGDATGVIAPLSGQNSPADRVSYRASGDGFQTDLFIPVWSSSEFKVHWESGQFERPDVRFEVPAPTGRSQDPAIRVSGNDSGLITRWCVFYNNRLFEINDRALKAADGLIPLSGQGAKDVGTGSRIWNDGSVVRRLSVSLGESFQHNNIYRNMPARYRTGSQMNEEDQTPGKPIPVDQCIELALSHPGSLARHFEGRPDGKWPPFEVAGPQLLWTRTLADQGHAIVLGVVPGEDLSPVRRDFQPRFRSDLTIFRWFVPVVDRPSVYPEEPAR